MKKQLMTLVLMLVTLAGTTLADTLYLRNGSVLKGRFISFENGRFIFELETGSRIESRPAEVVRLVIESTNSGSNQNYPNNPNNNSNYPPTGTNTGGGWTSYNAIDVRLEDQWIRSGITLRAGQTVRVDATGTIRMEGRLNTGPEGLNDRADADAPEPRENSGVLLAAIGTDVNSPSIVIGRSREFTADRDGMLYFTVNHGVTRGSTGAFRVRVQTGPISNNQTTGNSPPSNASRERVVTVRAGQAWTDTGIDVQPNTTYDIVAEGTIEISGSYRNVSADGETRMQTGGERFPLPNAPAGALIAKVRYRNNTDSQVVLVGSQARPSTEPNEYGRLMLGINDDYLQDNRGSFTVRIRW